MTYFADLCDDGGRRHCAMGRRRWWRVWASGSEAETRDALKTSFLRNLKTFEQVWGQQEAYL